MIAYIHKILNNVENTFHKLFVYPLMQTHVPRNAFESVLIRWMNIHPIIQSEVSQKNKYILMHIYGI